MPKTLFIKWSDLNETGIPIIDEQHRGIVDAINTLFYYMQRKEASKVIMATHSRVELYIHVHFLTEEHLLEKAKYNDLEEHIKKHESFRKEARILSIRLNDELDGCKLLPFLKQWWTEHINGVDQKYANQLRHYLENEKIF